MSYHHIPVKCPRCTKSLGWAAYDSESPHIVDYHCDDLRCNWKGDYDHLSGEYDEYSAEDYVISDNTPIEEALARAIELGCEVENI